MPSCSNLRIDPSAVSSLQIPLTDRKPTPRDYVFFFEGDHMLKNEKNRSLFIPLSEIYLDSPINLIEKDYFFLGEIDKKRTFALSSTKEPPEDQGFQMIPVRDILMTEENSTSRLVFRAKQLLHWHQSTLFSGCCGSPNHLSLEENAKICSTCKKVTYPQISPVVIVLIVKGRQILLARSPHFPEGMYSTIAGFIEAGETCEEALEREIKEEVGVKVNRISYLGSQSWPFPGSLMLGYLGEYPEGEISIDNKEIIDAKWFDIDQLPLLPPIESIARKMIDTYVSNSDTSNTNS